MCRETTWGSKSGRVCRVRVVSGSWGVYFCVVCLLMCTHVCVDTHVCYNVRIGTHVCVSVYMYMLHVCEMIRVCVYARNLNIHVCVCTCEHVHTTLNICVSVEMYVRELMCTCVNTRILVHVRVQTFIILCVFSVDIYRSFCGHV